MKSEQEIRTWLKNKLSEVLKSDQIDTKERFNTLGIDSKSASMLILELSQWIGKKLSPTLVWDYPTLDELVRFLAVKDDSKAESKKVYNKREKDSDEPVAIVGIGCRFPQASNPSSFWDLLKNKKNAVSKVPAERWNIDDLFDEDVKAPGKMNTMWGGFISGVDKFDPEFFGISPREAIQIDPQQRLMLELSWEALEDAGINPYSLKGSKTGVFYSAIWNDYMILNLRNGSSNIAQHTATGLHHSIISNRVSYFLGLQGPSISIDTACSSSLVTVHLALQSLRRRESKLALAGGVNLMLSPESTIAMSKFGAMAPDGMSKTFDSSANGYVRGEGGGVVVLKLLSEAIKDGDTIYSLILDSATNNDGFSNGLTAPNPKAQEEVLQEAYERSGIDPSQVYFVETHGTGTLLGDPIEAVSLGNILCKERKEQDPLILGALKTNIGHLEGAAGIAGLIKVALSLKNKQIPPNLHFQNPNPNIPFQELKLKVPENSIEWESNPDLKIAGVSSFGFGGSNCHVVLQEFSQAVYQLLNFSAKSQKELIELITDSVDILENGATSILELAQVLNKNPENESYVFRPVANSKGGLIQQMKAFVDEYKNKNLTPLTSSSLLPIAFVCSGHGSQWIGMGKSLLIEEPVFKSKMVECDRILQNCAGWSLLHELSLESDRSNLNDVAITQPIIFSFQVALAALWKHWGIMPDIVVGHSMGEVAAAHLAGILTLEDGIKIIYNRSKLMSQAKEDGAMALVELDKTELNLLIDKYNGLVNIASFNGPLSNVISGDKRSVEEIQCILTEKNVWNKSLNVSVASHSYQMDEVRRSLLQNIDDVIPLKENLPFVSTVYGYVLSYEHLNSSYWGQNLRKPVKFYDAVCSLLDKGNFQFIELSPHPVLIKSIEAICKEKQVSAFILGSLERNENERKTLLRNLSHLCSIGYEANWQNVTSDSSNSFLNNFEFEVGGIAKTKEEHSITLLSAHSSEALVNSASNLLRHLKEDSVNFRDLNYTLSNKRHHHKYRLGINSSNTHELAKELQHYLDKNYGSLNRLDEPKAPTSKLVFVFSGQGTQWVGMAKDLYVKEPVFQNTIKKCNNLLKKESNGKWCLIDKILNKHNHFSDNDTEFIQPIIFSVQVALQALLKSWGIMPEAVVGHSMGEVAAAYCSGILTLEDAVKVIYQRGRIMQEAKGEGAMAVIYLAASELLRLLDEAGFTGKIFIAAYNSSSNSVISGPKTAVLAFSEYLKGKGTSVKSFSKDYAFHCPMMDKLELPFLNTIAGIKPDNSPVPFYSTVKGGRLEGYDCVPCYWFQNIALPVKFSQAIDELLKKDYNTFLEIGPHNVLSTSIGLALEEKGREGSILASIKKAESSYKTLFSSLASLYNLGHDIDWKMVMCEGGRKVELPTYPFQRKRYWITDNEGNGKEAVIKSNHSDFGKNKNDEIRKNLNEESIYTLKWEVNSRTENLNNSQTEWVLFADNSKLGDLCLEGLLDLGVNLTMVYKGESFKTVDDYTYYINPKNTNDWSDLFAQLFKKHKVAGVGYFWGNDTICNTRDLTSEEISNAQGEMFRHIQQININLNQYASGSTCLYLFTQDLQPSRYNSNLQVQSSLLSGLSRVIGQENPNIRCKCIDLPNNVNTNIIEMLSKDLLSPDEEDWIAYRNGNRYVARLNKEYLGKRNLKCDNQKVYIITGGLGGIGIKAAFWLAKAGAVNVALISRSGKPLEKELSEQFQDIGLKVEIIKADVSNLQEVQKIFQNQKLPIGGIIHAAGVVSSGLFNNQSWNKFSDVLLPKVNGSWNLHTCSKDLNLDFFINISSISSILGSKGLSSYCAANAFLDSLAHYRKSCKLPCLTVNLGPIKETGMVVKSKDVFDQEILEKSGFYLMSSERVFENIERALDLTQVVVMASDEQKLSQTFGEYCPVLSHRNSKNGLQQHEKSLRKEIEVLSNEELDDLLTSYLKNFIKKVLGMPAISITRNIFELGMDSLLVLELIKLIEENIGYKCKSKNIYKHPTIEELVKFLVNEIADSSPISKEIL